MPKLKPKQATITLITAAFTLLALAALSILPVFAASGSVARVYYYPQDKGTYEAVDILLWQTTAVNTNTTVSASIDGAPPIILALQESTAETIPGGNASCDWYTWQTTIPAITAPGNHTLQFFGHYYVWQDKDQYWAEFNAQSDIHSFTINSNPQNPTPTPNPTTTETTQTPTASASTDTLCGILAATTAALITLLTLKRHYLTKKTQN